MKHKNLILIVVLVILAFMLTLTSLPKEDAVAAPHYVPTPTSAPEETVKGIYLHRGYGQSYYSKMVDLDPTYVKIEAIWRNWEPNEDGQFYTDSNFVIDLSAIVYAGFEPFVVINSPPPGYVRSGSGCQVLKDSKIDEAVDFALYLEDQYGQYIDYWSFGRYIDWDPGEGGYFNWSGYGCYDQNRQRYADIVNDMADALKNESANNKFYLGLHSWDDCVFSDPTDPDTATGCDHGGFLESIVDKTDGHVDGFDIEWWSYSFASGTLFYGTNWNLTPLMDWADDLANEYDIDYFFTATHGCVIGDYGPCYTASGFQNKQAQFAELAHNLCGQADYCKAWFWYRLPYVAYIESHNGMIDYQGEKKPVYYKFKMLPEPE